MLEISILLLIVVFIKLENIYRLFKQLQCIIYIDVHKFIIYSTKLVWLCWEHHIRRNAGNKTNVFEVKISNQILPDAFSSFWERYVYFMNLPGAFAWCTDFAVCISISNARVVLSSHLPSFSSIFCQTKHNSLSLSPCV